MIKDASMKKTWTTETSKGLHGSEIRMKIQAKLSGELATRDAGCWRTAQL